MNKGILFVGLFLFLALGMGLLALNSDRFQEPSVMEHSGAVMQESPKEDAHSAVEHAKLAGSRIDLANQDGFVPGELMLSFKLYGLDGHEFGTNDLKVAHEKRMHLILVRDDMTQYQHIHPEYLDTRWTVKATVPQQGTYQMYVDIEPVEETPVVLRVPLTIGGKTDNSSFPEPNTDRSAATDGIRAVLDADIPLKTQEETMLTFALSQSGEPVKNLEPYLGAFGHTIALRHGDPDDFFHAHPVTEKKPTDGQVVFSLSFPEKGRYTLYAQFQINGEVKTFPITVDVGEEGTASGSPAVDHIVH